MDELRVLCAQIPGNGLVAAECQNLAGGVPDREGVAVCQRVDLVPQSAYLSLGVRCLAEAETLPTLAAQIADIWRRPGFPVPETFRVEFFRLGGAGEPRKTEAVLAAANAIPARPNLTAPAQRFALVVQPDRLWFGQIMSEGAHSYQIHDSKPYRTSSSLPSRLARAAVNLVSPPAGSILDPFCGVGSILLEASALGLSASGFDRNIKMVGMTRRNLGHFDYAGQALLGDAQECTTKADAIVTDLPYGRLLEQDAGRLLPILKNLRGLAPRAVYFAEEDLTGILMQAGYTVNQALVVRKRHGMHRWVHTASAEG